MSRSTFTFQHYSLTAGTSVVRVVCGFLLRTLVENRRGPSSMINEIEEQLKEYVTVDHGFVRIELPHLKNNDLKYLIDVVSKCIGEIQAKGTHILLDEVRKMQHAGFLLTEDNYTQDMPTHYILDYFNQLKRMLEFPSDYDLSNENQSTEYPIIKD